jgi:glucose/arabinose dehydrogenase
MQRFSRTNVYLLTLILLIPWLTTSPSIASEEKIDLRIRSVDVKEVQVEGSRGAALAVLSNGRLLIGGGNLGDTLFLFAEGLLRELGKVSGQKERFRDGRFGPTDIAVLKEKSDSAEILISYPQLNKKRNCVRLVVYRYVVEWLNEKSEKKERWFLAKPCVPVTAVQHAAGRMAVIDPESVYLTTGDLGFSRIADKSARGWLGGVFKVRRDSVQQISSGHRNPQGIVLSGKSLYISEHGPRGGDELNLIKEGKDYGWPFVTYGQAYGGGDYVKPRNPGTHEGFEKPLHYWVPSVAPTELSQLPKSQNWEGLKGNLVMGTLAEESLFFIELVKPRVVGKVQKYFIGERIRDLEINPEGEIVASTDSGLLLFISKR